MSTRSRNTFKVMGTIAFFVLFVYPLSLYGYEFHINPLSDSASKKDISKYVGGSVSSATAEFGPPSMVRDNPSDPASIDYIYVGTSKVNTFVVEREGKKVVAAYQDKRGNWEGGVFPGYPAKKKKA
ncbi:MAG: hypothetical protein HY584_00740 [Candidatus Omnitrophica bacterium]|nr:hypothetical protein [Candidatus Omnitrophota bacterium]